MPTTLTECPSCNRKLRLPEEALGKQVQCPSCQTTFYTPALAHEPEVELASPAATEESGQAAKEEKPSPPIDEQFRPQLSLDDDDEPITLAAHVPTAPPPMRPVLLESELDDDSGSPATGTRRCPYCHESIPRNAGYCRFCGEEVDRSDRDWERPGALRRDCEPHRGGLILTLGVVGLVASFLHILAVIGLPLCISAWSMAQTDLKLMERGFMDRQGMSNTQAGRVCGIFGTVIGSLWMILFCCGGFNFLMR
jgi:LSD1 subclass zinc finger protein